MISFIIPTYNESEYIENTLSKLVDIVDNKDEIIVVDGDSEDNTARITKNFSQVILLEKCKRGRAFQMNTGADIANNYYLLFLHADTELSSLGLMKLKETLLSSNVCWGWFKMRFNSPRFIYRVLEKLAEIRNDVSQEPMGDHGIFVRKDLFKQLGGYPEIELMEDVELVKKLKKMFKGKKIDIPITTSVRRFENGGVFRTTLKIIIIRTLYYFNVNPKYVAKYYETSR